MSTPAKHLKDPRVPSLVLLALLSMGCTVPAHLGGMENGSTHEINVAGHVDGAAFDATLGPGSTIWLFDDDPVEVDVYDSSGAQIVKDHAVRVERWRNDDDLVFLVTRTGTHWIIQRRHEAEGPISQPISNQDITTPP